MKILKTTLFIVTVLLVTTVSFTHCSSAQNKQKISDFKFQEKTSFSVGEVSFEKWVAGIQGGGSGIHMYITIKENKNHVVFDSIYFRGYSAKMEIGKMGYFTSFKTALNQRKDYNMSHDENAEYGNDPSKIQNKSVFELQDYECVISYQEDGIAKYYKHARMIEKPSLDYPSAPPNKD